MKVRLSLGIPLLHVLLLLLAATATAQDDPDFPRRGLEDRIDFWKQIFTEYGKDDVVIHDRFHVNLIYDVVSEKQAVPRVRSVQRELNEVRLKLKQPEKLSERGQEMYRLLDERGIELSAAKLLQLRRRVHRQRGIKERFREGVIRSGRYLSHFEQILEREGVPSALALLPLVESSFENRAYSRRGAAGIWQFTRGTGRRYMRITQWVDERLNPIKATWAATRLLRHNYETLGAWPLAITAYNHGLNGMRRARSRHGSDIVTIINNYRSRLFGYASMNFYAEFLAAVEVYESYEQYFGALALDSPGEFDVNEMRIVRAGPGVDYQVRRGDTLSVIARRFGVSVVELMDVNGLASANRIYAGQVLRVAHAGTGVEVEENAENYRVRRGDTLSVIARRFGVSVVELMDVNGLASANRIYAGQVLRVAHAGTGVEVEENAENYRVRRGDTLSVIARRFGVSVVELIEKNRLASRHVIYAGQILVIR